MLRGVFGAERDEIAAVWRKVRNEGLQLHASTNVTRTTQ